MAPVLQSIEILPNIGVIAGVYQLPVLGLGAGGTTTLQLRAIGHYDDGSLAEITTSVFWNSDDNSVAVSITGLASTFGFVPTTDAVTATLGAVVGTASATSAAISGAAPTITGFTPTHGKSGSKVVITGSGFVGAGKVKFNSAAFVGFTQAFFEIVSDTTIWAWLNPGLTPGDPSGTGTIAVTKGASTATSAGTFTQDDPGVALTEVFTYISGEAGPVYTTDGVNVWIAGYDAPASASPKIRYSADGGATWAVEYAVAGTFFNGFTGTAAEMFSAISDSGTGMLLTRVGGVWNKTGGFICTNDAFVVNGFWSIAGPPNDLWVIDSFQQAILNSTDHGLTWQHVHSISDFGNQIFYVGPTNIWIACSDSIVVHWDGVVWTEINLSAVTPATATPYFGTILASGSDVWAVGQFGGTPAADGSAPTLVYHSKDGGVNWSTEAVELNVDNNVIFGAGGSAGAMPMVKVGSDVWLCGGRVTVSANKMILRSVGGADNWADIAVENSTVPALAAFPNYNWATSFDTTAFVSGGGAGGHVLRFEEPTPPPPPPPPPAPAAATPMTVTQIPGPRGGGGPVYYSSRRIMPDDDLPDGEWVFVEDAGGEWQYFFGSDDLGSFVPRAPAVAPPVPLRPAPAPAARRSIMIGIDVFCGIIRR